MQTQGDQVYNAEDLVEGLVREYLTRNSLAGTLKAFDCEKPRTPSSVGSRNALRKGLGLDKLLAKVNKPAGTATLELWVLYQQLKLEATASGQKHSAQLVESHPPHAVVKSQAHKLQHEDANGLSVQHSRQIPLQQSVHSGTAISLSDKSVQSKPHAPARRIHGVAQLSGSREPATVAQPTLRPLQQQGDLIVQDIEDDLLDVDTPAATVSGASLACSQPCSSGSQDATYPQAKQSQVPRHEMREMRQLLFGKEGNGSQLPWLAWKQGFFFCDRPGLDLGLVQRQGGPCGLLAALQAHVMAAAADSQHSNSLAPTVQQQRAVLAAALTSAVWQASSNHTAIVVCCKQASTSGLTFDQVCQSATQLTCKSRAELEAAFQHHLAQFHEPSGYGMLLFLFSLLLSHGLRETKSDMDEPDTCLIAAHGYCSQDLVNLVLTGHAVTNCFDGEREVGGKVCRGVLQRSRLGFLSLFEWFGYTQVGSHLKDPALPIWVVCSESHFTILYRIDSSNGRLLPTASSGSHLTLMYYDGLANQEQPIKLTLSTMQQSSGLAKHDQIDSHLHKSEDALIPPLEHVLHTKWPTAAVVWTGCEPIL